jgi:hypothetical protein
MTGLWRTCAPVPPPAWRQLASPRLWMSSRLVSCARVMPLAPRSFFAPRRRECARTVTHVLLLPRLVAVLRHSASAPLGDPPK